MKAMTLMVVASALLTFITLNPLFLLLGVAVWVFAKKQDATIKAADPDDSAERGGCGLVMVLLAGAMVALLAIVATMGEQRTADAIRLNVNAPLSTLEAKTDADLRANAQRVLGGGQ